MDDRFVCESCGVCKDLNECVAEEVFSRMGYDNPTCYSCVADGICYDFDWRVPFTVTKEQYEANKAKVIENLKSQANEEDFSSRSEDPYDDRDFIYDWEGNRDTMQSEF